MGDFLDQDVRAAAEAYRRSNLTATTRYALADAWVQLLYHALIALVLFAAPLALQPSPEVLTGYVFGMFYLMSPMWNIIGALPAVARGQVALAAIETLDIELDAAAPQAAGSLAVAPTSPPLVAMHSLRFRTMHESGTPGFQLGPIDLELRRGELLFVVGGNGSGKSTLVKLLCGLYAPDVGRNTGRWHHGGRCWTQRLPRAVFGRVLRLSPVSHRCTASTLNGCASTVRNTCARFDSTVRCRCTADAIPTTDLSQGQRKRLALVTAYLEDRPIVVFDEWAADQDPEYKRIFYTRLVPELRARGKTVVVITHDDRYFHFGDRVLKLEDGQIASLDAVATV